MDKFVEIKKLHRLLKVGGFPHTFAPLYGGWQIRLYADEELTQELDDAVCHKYSHGFKQGLLETYNLGECEGFETAEQVFKGWIEMYNKKHNRG
jgi:hypothetical protein